MACYKARGFLQIAECVLLDGWRQLRDIRPNPPRLIVRDYFCVIVPPNVSTKDWAVSKSEKHQR
jgi:hypothetical protein